MGLISLIGSLIKYGMLSAIIFFLIKAFAEGKLDDKQIALLVVLIMLVVIFIVSQSNNKKEGYQITATPLVPSVYINRDNHSDPVPDTPLEPTNPEYTNADLEDMKDIMGIDKAAYAKIMGNELNAMKKIVAKHDDEMVYTTSHPFNTVPLGSQLYGYTYLPAENWFRAWEQPPACVAQKKCPVCPNSNPSISGLLEFDTKKNITGPIIDIRYAQRVMNATD